MTTVAVIGTGVMGSAMARRMAGQNLDVHAWNRSPDKPQALASWGVSAAASVEEAVRDADAVITTVPTGDVAASLAERFLPAMPAEAVWLQMSTVGGTWTERLLRQAADAGRHMLDSPVSGSSEPAAHGTLTLIVSGDKDALGRARPVLEVLGSHIVHVGTGAQASRVKLIVNSWMTASVVAMADTLLACEQLGVDPSLVLQVLDEGPLRMPYAMQKAEEMRAHSYPAGFPLALALKDLGLLADERGQHSPLSGLLQGTLHRAVEAGHDREDIAAVAEVLRQDIT
ncbi:NAD(P)-dependent oxidoreductase [Nonomuraea sp. NEAU-A123]|uniref:NAD(P)-dependent oxidoreductase n=1 Tax=Nonomuraea sp. NEAU-A123 TaxID=2839649 RepID=UPI001BE4C30D|nr:NAD(P)-dependent oxidoreductase [Nonomuraea sp. NEAU-A123]MBT2225167.1 NAD(P)-dependent oxidoreductase [Nonomuraea sp. NEAU-A123]